MKNGMIIAFMAIVLLANSAAGSTLEVAGLFGNGMVLQREQPLPVWGRAAPGTEVTVALAGQQATAAADTDGTWRVTLPAMPVGGPHEMRITAGAQSLAFTGALIGDVWLFSGGSGMAATVGSAPEFRGQLAEPPVGIRILIAPGQIAGSPARAFGSKPQWVPAGMSHGVASFSATAVAFAQEWRRLTDPEGSLPIGLIQASSANSLTASWAGRDALASDPVTLPLIEAYDKALETYLEASRGYIPLFKAWVEAMSLAEQNGTAWPQAPAMPPEPRSDPRRPYGFFNGMIAPLAPYAVRGVLWNHGELDVVQPDLHRAVLTMLVKGWRDAWKRPDLPFVFAQLGASGAPDGSPTEEQWVAFRAAQAAVRGPGIWMVETTDLEKPNAVAVGKRMAEKVLEVSPAAKP
jgi:sialate O-acetylesterase